MFTFAIFIGAYSYLIFALGIFGFLTKEYVQTITLLWAFILLIVKRRSLQNVFNYLQNYKFNSKNLLKQPISLIVFLIVLQAMVNFIGVLGPELAFDALWYHLTLPKLYLLNHSLYHIPGGLLYYSDMPKLGEMLYVGVLTFGNEIGAKFVHFIFGVLACILLYKFSRKYFSQLISLLIVLIFYTNLVVDWESITAYIDLIRTFFEFLALYTFINWFETRKKSSLIITGLMTGLVITTKVLAIGSYIIFLFLLIGVLMLQKRKIIDSALQVLIYTMCSFIIPLPWFIFSYSNTGNPVYPFFSHVYEVSASSPNPVFVITDLWNLFLRASDPISPLYLIFFPLLFITFSKFRPQLKLIVWYCGLSLILWYFTPRTGGGRFILPYLPAFSLVCGAVYSEILERFRTKGMYLSKLLVTVIILVSLTSIGYRAAANYKYISVLLGKESEQSFLTENLNFGFGDFYDTDNYFASHIKQTDKVLLYGFHNLYYVEFPFIDNTWVKRGDQFNYIATQKTNLPSKYRNWRLVYSNDKTMVKLFRPPVGECQKLCVY